jgi:hypothetical protein
MAYHNLKGKLIINLRESFGLNEDDIEDIANEVIDDKPEGNSAGNSEPSDTPETPDTSEPDNTANEVPEDNNESDPSELEDDNTIGAKPEAPESEKVPGTGDMVKTSGLNDLDKVSSLYTDIGNPETDYGLTNPNNIRFSKFRFKKSGINIDEALNDVEKKIGLSVDKILYRLTPEQYESYKEKGRDIRNKFDLIKLREKNIIMFNARIPIYYKIEGKLQKIDEKNPEVLKQAYEKIDLFLIKKFGEDWVDDLNAIEFLQGIKVNFSEKETITPNMISTQFFKNFENKLIPFNKLYVKTPKSVEDFISSNKDNQIFLRSAIFRTIAASHINGSTDSNGVYCIISSDEATTQDNVPEQEENIDASADEAIPDQNDAPLDATTNDDELNVDDIPTEEPSN